MAGSTLAEFTTLAAETGPVVLTGPQEFQNMLIEHSYFLEHMLRGAATRNKALSGGIDVRETLITEEGQATAEYLPGETLSYENPQVTSVVHQYLRFIRTPQSWNDKEELLQGTERMDRNGRFMVYKDVMKSKEIATWTSHVNKIESYPFRSPHNQQAEQEGQNGKQVTSIYAFIQEPDNTYDATNEWHPVGWTTVEGIDPNSNDWWRNQSETYDKDDPADIAGQGDGLFDAFERISTKVRFKPPGTYARYLGSPQLFSQFIACSLEGQVLVKKQLREGNDFFAGMGNRSDAAYPNPQWNGFDLVYVASLDTAALYYDGVSAYVAEATATRDGPRFYFINANYLYLVFHREKFFQMGRPFFMGEQPDTFHRIVDTWMNFMCTSRRHQGIVFPKA